MKATDATDSIPLQRLWGDEQKTSHSFIHSEREGIGSEIRGNAEQIEKRYKKYFEFFVSFLVFDHKAFKGNIKSVILLSSV